MKQLIFQIIFSTSLLSNCTSQNNIIIPIEFSKEYFITNQNWSDDFNPEHENKIIFLEDGTYTRSEFISFKELKEPFERKFVWIDKLKGSWVFDGKNLFLSDEAIMSFYCKSIHGELIDCGISSEEFRFGSEEYLKSAFVYKIFDNIIQYNMK